MYSRAGRSDILSTLGSPTLRAQMLTRDFGEHRNGTKEVLLDSIKKDGLIMHPCPPGMSVKP